jgi:hypothetical protein
MEALAPLRYAFVSCLGRVLSDVELNTVCATHVDQGIYYAKRRRWFVTPLVAAGNVYLKLLGAHAQVLSDHEWRRWEAAVYRVVYDVELATDERGRLLIPAWSGVSLAAYLDSELSSQAEKLRAIRLAVQALRQLHCVVIEWPDGQKRPLSHGDATVENVIVNPAHTNASWFDFDTIHDSRMDAVWRHADDLRALTYSAAARLPAATFTRITQTLAENYGSTRTLDALADAVAYRRSRPISFHLAQARIGYQKRRLLDEALLNSLGCRDGI